MMLYEGLPRQKEKEVRQYCQHSQSKINKQLLAEKKEEHGPAKVFGIPAAQSIKELFTVQAKS